jgi:hypothetical protein
MYPVSPGKGIVGFSRRAHHASMLGISIVVDDASRAQRFAIETPLAFQVVGENVWRSGVSLNISGSGILFTCTRQGDLPDTGTFLACKMTIQQNSGERCIAQLWGQVIRVVRVGERKCAAVHLMASQLVPVPADDPES